MTTLSSYNPFLIGGGKSQSGLFTYYESWINPEDAYDNLQDCYINRGRLYKRDGEVLLGNLSYANNQILTYGSGATDYVGNFNTAAYAHLPLTPGSIVVQTITSAGVIETYSDNGSGILTGNNGGTGTINYTTGAWTIVSANALPSGTPITITYEFVSVTATNPLFNMSIAQIAATSTSSYSGTFPYNLPIDPGTAVMTVDKSSGGLTYYYDDGAGNLRISLPSGTIVGSLNYQTGAWSFTIPSSGTAVRYSAIQLGFVPTNSTPTIMGINQWNDEANNTFQLVVEDTHRAAVFDTTSYSFNAINQVAETIFVLDGTTTIYSNFETGVIPAFPLIAPLSITIELVNNVTGAVADTTTDDGQGDILVGDNAIIKNGTINYLTGDLTINLNSAQTAGWALNATFTLQNDYFFGDQSNFFNWTNWEPPTNLIVTQVQTASDATQFQRGFLYLTNDYDPVTLYYGINGTLSRPSYAVQQSYLGYGLNQIRNCLDVKVYQNRLLFCRPTTTISDGNPDPQSIRWSAQFQPTNFVADIPGSGGELSAPTSDWMQSAKFLKDYLVISMQDSIWVFRATGNAFDPFRYYKANSTKNCNAPYGTIEYEDQIKQMGTKGLVYFDGNSSDRYDFKIIDQFQSINQSQYQQCFGQRFDILNQSWMTFPSMTNNSLLSNQILLHNYVEDSWAVFNMNLSCLGLGFGIRDIRWEDFAVGSDTYPDGLTWEQADFAWNSYLNQSEALRLLGGDFNGNVLQLNDGPTDDSAPIYMYALTKKYNPFAKDGVKAQFGYIDVYYTVNPAVELTFNFFIDNNTDIAFSRNLHLTGTNSAGTAWQRIFLNVQGEFLQWSITDNGIAGFQLLGTILWAYPRGRLTP